MVKYLVCIFLWIFCDLTFMSLSAMKQSGNRPLKTSALKPLGMAVNVSGWATVH